MKKADGRMIRNTISSSKKFASLSPEAAVLFALLIPHYNAHGKMNGGPGYIKDEICPYIPYLTYENIGKLLQEINDKTNVKWFEHDGRYWIHSLNFLSRHQSLKAEKMGPDLLPNYSGSTSGLVSEYDPHEVEVEDEVEDEDEVEGDSGSSPGKAPAKQLHEIWNEACPSLPQVRELSDGRKKKIKLRLKERPVEQWAEIFARIEKSDFCRGNGEGSWQASFDWIIKNADNGIKVLEGKYDNRPKGVPPRGKTQQNAALDRLRQMEGGK